MNLSLFSSWRTLFGYIRSRLFKIEFSKTRSKKTKKFFRLANFSTYMRIYKVVLTFIFIFYSTLFCARVHYYKIQTQTNEKELHIILYIVSTRWKETTKFLIESHDNRNFSYVYKMVNTVGIFLSILVVLNTLTKVCIFERYIRN